MYDPFETLASIDDHKWAILALCGVAMIFNYAWFFAAFKAATRDRVYSVPMFATFFWLAGDASMVWRFDTWFNVYDHWYVKLFWLALVFTVLFELAFTYQILRYGRDEHLPSWSQAQWTALVVCGVAAALVAWSFVKHLIGDELYIDYFHIAVAAGPIFGAALLLRRRSARGQTPFIWAGYTGMSACWFTATALWFGDAFQSFEHILLYVLATAMSAGMYFAVRLVQQHEAAAGERVVAPSPRARRPLEGVVAAK